MEETNKNAHVAGLLYFLIVLTAPFSLLYVPNKLIVPGDATTTASRILASETLFRLGIVAELTGTIIFLLLVLALYRLLSGVNKTHAVLMAVLALMSIPITFLNVVNQLTALILLHGRDYLSIFDKHQLDALAMLFLRRYNQGIIVNEIFWGLWLFPFGLLVMRSGFLPRILGILLIINSFVYPIVSLTSFLFPDYSSAVNRYAFIPETGELWIMLWLLIMGAKVQPTALPSQQFT
jgi:type IV secretory pathway VirB3-like protein